MSAETQQTPIAEQPATRWRAAWTDRVNPILVKEVRQSLRGRYFTVLFFMTIGLALLISAFFLIFYVGTEPPEDSGPAFFLWMYGCLSVAVHLFVPFAAFMSLGSERDEDTWDLLVLSNLRPRQILLGKLLGSGIQVLLYFSAFGPFLAFAFLLPGLDLAAAGWSLSLTLVSSMALATLAISLATLLRSRLARSFKMAFLAILLVPGAIFPITASAEFVFLPYYLGSTEFLLAIAAFLSATITVSVLLFLFACTRLAHPEENRSSGLRVLTTAVIAAAMVWMFVIYGLVHDVEVLGGFAAGIVLGTMVLCLSFASEAEPLGRRVRLSVAKSRLLAFLSTPFLPGGGRGMIFYLIHAAVVMAIVFPYLHVMTAFDAGTWIQRGLVCNAPHEEAAMWILVTFLYCTIYLALPTALFARGTRRLVWRVLARASVPLLILATFLAPTMIRFLMGMEEIEIIAHQGNPIWVLYLAHEGEDVRGTLALIGGFAAFAVLVNVPRMLGGTREVLRESALRRAGGTERPTDDEGDYTPLVAESGSGDGSGARSSS